MTGGLRAGGGPAEPAHGRAWSPSCSPSPSWAALCPTDMVPAPGAGGPWGALSNPSPRAPQQWDGVELGAPDAGAAQEASWESQHLPDRGGHRPSPPAVSPALVAWVRWLGSLSPGVLTVVGRTVPASRGVRIWSQHSPWTRQLLPPCHLWSHNPGAPSGRPVLSKRGR